MSNNELRTYIEGLDALFGGYIITNEKRNPCILLEGEEGSGKTTLALQMAVNIARETKGISIFFTTEQHSDQIKRKIESMNWVATNKSVSLLSGPKRELKKASKTKVTKGYVFLLTVPIDNFQTTRRSISSNIDEIKSNFKSIPIKYLVLDSLNAVQGDIPRDDFLILNQKCAKVASLSVLIDEGSSNKDRFLFRRYISDIEIRLGTRYRTERKDYSERYIEIVKARNQFHYRGKHPFSIVDPTKKVMETGKDKSTVEGGVYVYPSMGARLAYQLRETEKCEKKKREGEKKRFRFGIGTLDRLVFGGSEQEKGGVVEESMTLVVGERGTKKTVIGLHFLAAGIGEKEKCLLVSLKDDEAAIRAVAGGYKTLRHHFCEKNEYLEIKHIRPSYLTPGNFLDQINSWLEASEREGKKTGRVVFDNFAQIRIRFPLLDAERMFIPTLVDLFKTKGITSLFIDIVEEPGKAVWEYKSPILDLADYVIATQHLAFLGRDHTVITVRRSMEGKHNAEPAELRREEDRIVIEEHAFDGITGVLEQDPKPAEIFIKLFYENKAEATFNKEVKEDFKEKYKDQVHVSSFSRADSAREYGRIKRYWMESPSSIVKVVSLDEYWVKYAAQEGLLWEIDPDWFIEGESREWISGDEPHDFLHGGLIPAKVNGKLYALPNHIDLGLFCYRQDLFVDLFGATELVPKDVCALVDLILTKHKAIKASKVWGFAFDMESEETLICTFMEFVFNANTRKGKVGHKFHDLRDGGLHEPLILHDGHVKEAVVWALQRMKGLVKHGLMPFPCTIDNCRDSILSRHWYSTVQFVNEYWDMSNKSGKSQGDKGKYKRANLCIVPTESTVELGAKGTGQYVCSGSWYLGILKQSLRPMLGFHVIDEVTSPRKNFRRYELGAGFPTSKSFYRFRCRENVKNLEGLKYGEVEDCLEGSTKCNRRICRRESFCGNDVRFYRSVRSELAEVVLEVLEGSLEERKGMERIVNLIGIKRQQFFK